MEKEPYGLPSEGDVVNVVEGCNTAVISVFVQCKPVVCLSKVTTTMRMLIVDPARSPVIHMAQVVHRLAI